MRAILMLVLALGLPLAANAGISSVTVTPNPVVAGGVVTVTIVTSGSNVGNIRLTTVGGWVWVNGSTITNLYDGTPGQTFTVTGVAPGGNPGQFTLQWWNLGGTNQGITNHSFPVTNPPPTAAFTATPLVGDKPLPVTFTSTSSGNPNILAWNFGDGGTASGSPVQHTFTSYGTFTVTLTATNGGGSSSSARTIQVVLGAPSVDFVAGFQPITNVLGSTVNVTIGYVLGIVAVLISAYALARIVQGHDGVRNTLTDYGLPGGDKSSHYYGYSRKAGGK